MQIKNRISAFQEEMTSWRHHFHEYPELAYKEINTSKKVVELLKSFGINNIEEGLGKTGVVATLENGTGKMRLKMVQYCNRHDSTKIQK